MRSIIIAVVLLLFTNGAFMASTQSAQTADAVDQMMTMQSLPDAVMMNCCVKTASMMGHGHMNCAMDCHYLAPYMYSGFLRTVPVKVSTYTVLPTSSVEDHLMRPPIVS
ncbi:hypothetical protein [Hoeflea alexandrii]|uniref:hypothetical protein n=1 Tax=Hoeflea alexandrii TaxID=288436 RepID=UPI0022AF4AC6|nr:hypothetical protein [Hoeflea alexandrii]MCZ4288458.1 hypothetical protein [Hoeflea alexandrii]